MTLTSLLKVVRTFLEGIQADLFQAEPMDCMLLPNKHLVSVKLILGHSVICLILLLSQPRGRSLLKFRLVHISGTCAF